MFWDTFWSRLGQKCLVSLYFWPKLAKSGQESGQKVANIQPFCELLGRKTCFLSLYGHLLSSGSDSGGPTHRFEEDGFIRPTSLLLLFSRKGAIRIPH